MRKYCRVFGEISPEKLKTAIDEFLKAAPTIISINYSTTAMPHGGVHYSALIVVSE